MINRSAISVQARQPFLDWLKSLPDPVEPDMTIEEVNRELNVYLLPEYDFDDDAARLLEQFYDMIFEKELGAWWTDENNWPRNRDFITFQKWFEIQFHSSIEDLADTPLLDDE